MCSNNNGSFTCSCYTGYEFGDDGVTCNGMSRSGLCKSYAVYIRMYV